MVLVRVLNWILGRDKACLVSTYLISICIMNNKFKNKYRIQSIRLQNWDYGWNGLYFVTICTKNRKCFFGDIVDGKMNLSRIGIIADILWYEIKNHAQNIELDEFTVMPKPHSRNIDIKRKT
jgi:hypothetical protein